MNTITKAKSKDWTSTSFHEDTIVATPNQIIESIGEPTYVENTGEDKTNLEWELLLDDGTFFTIYDWKEYRPLEYNAPYTFHIGAKNPESSKKAHQALTKLLIS